jgi:small subunit ribosomal protein S18
MIDKDDKLAPDEDLERIGEDGEGRRSSKRYTALSDRNRCRFTRAGVDRIDYKDVVTLQKLMTNQGRIFSRKRSGNAARFQRMVKVAIKRARFMALLPYIG